MRLAQLGLTDGDARAVASALRTAPAHVRKVDLSANAIGEAGALALAVALRHNGEILSVDLFGNPIPGRVKERLDAIAGGAAGSGGPSGGTAADVSNSGPAKQNSGDGCDHVAKAASSRSASVGRVLARKASSLLGGSRAKKAVGSGASSSDGGASDVSGSANPVRKRFAGLTNAETHLKDAPPGFKGFLKQVRETGHWADLTTSGVTGKEIELSFVHQRLASGTRAKFSDSTMLVLSETLLTSPFEKLQVLLLKHLGISNDAIVGTSSLGLAYAVRGLPRLTYFSLATNFLESSGCAALMAAVGEGCPDFTSCSFANNKIEDAGLDAVCDFVLANPKMEMVKMAGNKVSATRKRDLWKGDGAKRIKEVVKMI